MAVVRTTHITLRNREEEGASTLLLRVRNHDAADGANRAREVRSLLADLQTDGDLLRLQVRWRTNYSFTRVAHEPLIADLEGGSDTYLSLG